MSHIDVSGVSYTLADGRPLLDDVSFRVGDGRVGALIGANGAGKSTLLRIIRGELRPDAGGVVIDGGLAVMDQFVGHVRDDRTVHDLLVGVAPKAVKAAAEALEAAENAIIERDETDTQLRYANALAEYADAGGYEQEVVWDQCTVAALGVPFERARYRAVRTLSGGEQKRLVLEALLRGPEQVLLLDEPDNYLDVPAKRWLEEQLRATQKTVLVVSHDRELLANAADRIITLELGAAGNTTWTHGGGFVGYHDARRERMERLEELRRRWDEEHAKLKALVLRFKEKAKYNSDLANAYQAAQTRLARFETAGPPQEVPREQNVRMRLTGARTGRRVLECTDLELTGLMRPFDAEVWFGERVAVLGSNGSGKSHFLRLLAAGGTDPDPSAGHLAAPENAGAVVPHTGNAKLGARVAPGLFAQAHEHPELVGRTLLEILHRGDERRDGMPREAASRVLDRYGLAGAAEQTFESLSGGQQARLQILLLELSGATLLLLDEPTDNLDLVSAEALEEGLAGFEGTVIAVTHDRWFARGFDRFLVFGSDGAVYETDEPVWDERRVSRAR
ncbi:MULTISPECIES: ABC-F family ATP-binding cassette domain-containing protein [unclassified Leifsonia]|uniref:ABC-F family ATP-binding cassette domain-containing protein n=1 Tax=unclassified Leifsonia TaxID=2663824 RepID=UPI00037D959B|nr:MULTISPECIES: ATP-binding cassette domain-containing protein [unclassified Leifsonia]TDP99168.1 ATPase subunit of ABC transporter with duplicated ATPase domains [Leifsonia sp. 115AMFTsu3.1]